MLNLGKAPSLPTFIPKMQMLAVFGTDLIRPITKEHPIFHIQPRDPFMTTQMTTPADNNEQPTSIEIAARRRLPAFYFLAQTFGQRNDISIEEFIRFARNFSTTKHALVDIPKPTQREAFDAAMDLAARTYPEYLGLLLAPLDESLMELIKQDAKIQFRI
ncbi:hypothetical protein E2K99_22680 [Herbaspirillum huttiense]|uniref:hypothetical protein n=1 Tax=Herbaspirillum huttiense TaxID=863372 RepID=UPI0010669DDB|nr:hypothetical protein [Herbaspirillum huttiense]QBP77624.1 hypothetical protein E2K99_22680 [Herbaspirillum huttiense]